MRGYKVCRTEGDKLISVSRLMGYDKERLFSVEYEIGKWSEPKLKGSRLYFFKSIELARKFSFNLVISGIKIFECETQNPSRVSMLGDLSCLNSFWNAKLLHKKMNRAYKMFDVPVGTYSASRIKLLRKV